VLAPGHRLSNFTSNYILFQELEDFHYHDVDADEDHV
jgi:hypothetical protein